MKMVGLRDVPTDVLDRIIDFLAMSSIANMRYVSRDIRWTAAHLKKHAQSHRIELRRDKRYRESCAHATCDRVCVSYVSWYGASEFVVTWIPYCFKHADTSVLKYADLYCVGKG